MLIFLYNIFKLSISKFSKGVVHKLNRKSIYKLLESMNQVDILKHVPRLKSKHGILEHDKIWRRICTQLEWEFIKTRAPCHQIGY